MKYGQSSGMQFDRGNRTFTPNSTCSSKQNEALYGDER